MSTNPKLRHWHTNYKRKNARERNWKSVLFRLHGEKNSCTDFVDHCFLVKLAKFKPGKYNCAGASFGRVPAKEGLVAISGCELSASEIPRGSAVHP